MDQKSNDPMNTVENRAAKLVAVIDIGATSIRMQISQIDANGEIQKLESLSHGVSIGKDSFTNSVISKPTIEDCVRVLKIYRKKLAEYGINDPHSVRVVATSGVREATNRLAFNDRIFIATGLEIDSFDEAELHRVTYLGIQPYLNSQQEVFVGRNLVCEVGGGTTEILLMQKVDVLLSRTFRMGSLRLRKALESYDVSAIKMRKLLESQISQSVHQIYHVCEELPARYVAMGGDIRFLVNHLGINFEADKLAELKLEELQRFTNEVLQIDPDRIMTKFHLSQTDAESLGPALLAHLMIAKAFGSETIFVANVNLRDGLSKEIAQGHSWSESVQSQIIRSAMRLGKRYDFDQSHAVHVAFIACRLFEQLMGFHGMEDRHKIILHLASLLHEIGIYVSTRSYHKHSMYLIRNSEFFGVNSNDLLLISLVARYHRRAFPLPSHEGYSLLGRKDRVLVAKLASILRLAVALDATRQQRVDAFECIVQGNEIQIAVDNLNELAIEASELQSSAQMMDDLFGAKLSLVSRQYE